MCQGEYDEALKHDYGKQTSFYQLWEGIASRIDMLLFFNKIIGRDPVDYREKDKQTIRLTILWYTKQYHQNSYAVDKKEIYYTTSFHWQYSVTRRTRICFPKDRSNSSSIKP